MTVTFFVAGLPSTQGNKSAFVTKSGKAVMREGRSKQAKSNFDAWRHAVGDEARRYAGDELEAGPVLVTLAFGLARPASAPKRRRTWPIAARSGDVDKLARACLDAVTGVLLADDSQVVGLAVTKAYGRPGVAVTVDPIEADPTVDWWPTWQPVLHLEEAPA
jgi:crossover junction endodeoxyribonuclease RusA